MGSILASATTNSIAISYPCIDLTLVVGICGGSPKGENGKETMLGDVVISDSIVQYDYGTRYPNKLKRKDSLREPLGRPTAEFRVFLHTLKTLQGRKEL